MFAVHHVEEIVNVLMAKDVTTEFVSKYVMVTVTVWLVKFASVALADQAVPLMLIVISAKFVFGRSASKFCNCGLMYFLCSCFYFIFLVFYREC